MPFTALGETCFNENEKNGLKNIWIVNSCRNKFLVVIGTKKTTAQNDGGPHSLKH